MDSRVPYLVQAADVVGVVMAGRNPIQVVDSQGLEQGNDDGVSLAIVAAVEKESLPCGATQEGGIALVLVLIFRPQGLLGRPEVEKV